MQVAPLPNPQIGLFDSVNGAPTEREKQAVIISDLRAKVKALERNQAGEGERDLAGLHEDSREVLFLGGVWSIGVGENTNRGFSGQ